MRILFVDIDTLRPDHMGCYGYSRNTTPNIDCIADEGIKFNNYYCSDAPCLPSRASLTSGMFGIHNGAVGHGGTAADKRYMGESREFRDFNDENNFNNIFRKAGMYTASISTFPERHSAWWFNAGFNETHNVGDGGMESGEKVLPIALDWIERNSDKDNWFLHVHLWDPHTPYRAPAEFGNPFENEPLDTWITEDVLKQHLKHVGPHSINEINMYDDQEFPEYPRHPGKANDMNGLRRIIDGYDCGVRYADHLIGQLFDLLREKNIFEDTAIIITSDHGENMGELGIYSEHATADHPTCHIPMIIKWPSGLKNHVDNGFHYNLDLAPTMAELLNVEPYDKWDGQSYAKTITDGEETGRDYLVLSQLAHVCQRSARFGDWLYIRTYHDGFHLFDKEMLFNLKDDVYQQNDIKDLHPDICAKGAKIILDWHDEMMATSDSQIDPLWTVLSEGGPSHTRGHLEGYLERLEKTGRSEGAQKLREKYLNK
jgi:choline-sulfatase